MRKKHTYLLAINKNTHEKLSGYCNWLLLDYLRTAKAFPKIITDDLSDEDLFNANINKKQYKETLQLFNKPLSNEEKERFTQFIVETLLSFEKNTTAFNYLATLTAEALLDIEFASNVFVGLSKATPLCTEFVQQLFKKIEDDPYTQPIFNLNDLRLKRALKYNE